MKEFDQQQIVEFYDVYPFFYGTQQCSPPMEAALAARQLNGLKMTIYEAEGRLAAAIRNAGVLKINPEKNCILLTVSYDNRPYDQSHTFILIKFR